MANRITLSDAVDSANTGLDAIKRALIVENDTGLKCLRIQDVSQSKSFNDWGFTEVTEENFERFQLKKSDIIVARTGGSVGVNQYISEDMQAVFNNGLIRLRVKTNQYYPEYIYYLLQSNSFKHHINSIAYSTSAQPNMKIRDLLRFSFKEQSFDTQKAIAHILGALDDKIELNRQMNETLEAMAQALFKSWFVDFDPVIDNALLAAKTIPEPLKGRAEMRQAQLDSGKAKTNSEINDLFPSEFEFTEELGWIPKGWGVGSLGEYIDVKRGGSPRPIHDFLAPEGLHWVKISDATASNSRFIVSTKQFIKPEGLKKTTLLKKGSLILSNSATPGLPKFLDIDACIHDGWLHFPKKETLTDFYLYQLFLVIRKELLMQGNGSVFTNLKTDILKNHTTVIPSADILDYFDSLIVPMHKKMHSIQLNSDSLAKLRDTILPKLMSGELRIPDDVL